MNRSTWMRQLNDMLDDAEQLDSPLIDALVDLVQRAYILWPDDPHRAFEVLTAEDKLRIIEREEDLASPSFLTRCQYMHSLNGMTREQRSEAHQRWYEGVAGDAGICYDDHPKLPLFVAATREGNVYLNDPESGAADEFSSPLPSLKWWDNQWSEGVSRAIARRSWGRTMEGKWTRIGASNSDVCCTHKAAARKAALKYIAEHPDE